MKLFKSGCFNEALQGKCLRITSESEDEFYAWDGLFLVKDVCGKYLVLTNSNGDRLELHKQEIDETYEIDILNSTSKIIPKTKNIDFEQMKEHIYFCADSWIEDSNGNKEMTGTMLNENFVAFVNEENNELQLYYKNNHVATIHKHDKTYKALKKFMKFIKECSEG